MNIEEFQSEIQKAESYLLHRSSASEVHLSNNRRSIILEQFGRNPIDTSKHEKTAQSVMDRIFKEKENNSNDENTNRYSNPEIRNQLIDRLLAEHKIKKKSSSNHFKSQLPLEIKDEIKFVDNVSNKVVAYETPNSYDSPETSIKIPRTVSIMFEQPEFFEYEHVNPSTVKSSHRSSSATRLNRRVEEMRKQHELQLQKREKLKREFESQQEAECTFSPMLSKGTVTIVQSLSHRRAQHDDVGDEDVGNTVHDKLYSQAELKVQQHRKLQKSVLEQRHSDCTFSPNIQDSKRSACLTLRQASSSVDDPPIHERVAELQKERVERLRQLAKETEDERNQSTSFTPQINPMSRKMAARRYSTTGRRSDSATRDPNPTRSSSVSVSRVYDADSLDECESIAHLDVASRLTLEGKLSELRKKQLQQEFDRADSVNFIPKPLSKGTLELAKDNPIIR